MSESLALTVDRRPRLTHFRVKPAVRRQLEDYVNTNETSMRCVILEAMRRAGINVQAEDLTPERKRSLKPYQAEEGEADKLVGLSVSLPVYVRILAEEWMHAHPGMRLVNMLHVGLKEMGFTVDEEDLKAKWTWKPFTG